MNHAQWRTARAKKLLGETMDEDPAVVELREEIRLAMELGQAVFDRRTELGISQAEMARRAGMTQPQVSRIEGGDTLPTLPLLDRLARALESALDIHLVPGTDISVRFTAHAA
ncbi:helix-turn-helix domain-containing protein [Streptomyces sp. SID13666]|uniref:helix-turn-helix domain-containing protein n=1 Tax=unclassified Streptomyces TaxID=2593676 RepID=UPI0013C1A595|nr:MULTISPECIES: helix-turn-helix domain-containing protein [unclassified Streptomyces]NEA56886.1 helix-turn-helix domain-containing protein [Streptomyces sp. SID13666]NEA75714.1 helix-turn-helix domain-containing protein [Streptomyces sp. SID13588]